MALSKDDLKAKLEPPETTPAPEAPSASELKKADAGLPIYNEEDKTGEPLPDTPSGKALKKVGNLDGEDVDPADYHKAGVHGEAYQAEKRKHRWG